MVGIANSSGSISKTYAYDAFGVELSPVSSDANPFRYCSEYFDAESGDYYLRARYYAPGLGRFLSEDPVRDGDNWYVYCFGNPIRFIDPSGLEQIVVSGGAYHYNPDEPNAYQYEFVDSALLQIKMLDGDATFLIANAGWTDDQYSKIEQAASERGINLVWFSDTDELTNYINYGGIDGSGNRENDPITGFYVFAHGTTDKPGNFAIRFGYFTDKDSDLSWYTEDLENIDCSAFSSSVVSEFYSCRTGNRFNNGNYAQSWADITGGVTYAYSGLNGRSEYSDILGHSYYRWLSTVYINWKAERGGFSERPGEAWALPHASYLTTMTTFLPGGPPFSVLSPMCH